MVENIIGRKDSVNQTLGLISTTYLEELLQQFPSARVFCRYWGKHRLDSESYARGCNNSFVEIGNENRKVEQILTFYDNG